MNKLTYLTISNCIISYYVGIVSSNNPSVAYSVHNFYYKTHNLTSFTLYFLAFKSKIIIFN